MNLRQKRERLINEIAQTIIKRSRHLKEVFDDPEQYPELPQEHWLPGGTIQTNMDKIRSLAEKLRTGLEQHRTFQSLAEDTKAWENLRSIFSELYRKGTSLVSLLELPMYHSDRRVYKSLNFDDGPDVNAVLIRDQIVNILDEIERTVNDYERLLSRLTANGEMTYNNSKLVEVDVEHIVILIKNDLYQDMEDLDTNINRYLQDLQGDYNDQYWP